MSLSWEARLRDPSPCAGEGVWVCCEDAGELAPLCRLLLVGGVNVKDGVRGRGFGVGVGGPSTDGKGVSAPTN